MGQLMNRMENNSRVSFRWKFSFWSLFSIFSLLLLISIFLVGFRPDNEEFSLSTFVAGSEVGEAEVDGSEGAATLFGQQQKIGNVKKRRRSKRETTSASWMTRPLRIQTFKTAYEQPFNLNTFLDRHEVSFKLKIPYNLSDGEKLLMILKRTWKNSFHQQKLFILIYPLTRGELGKEVRAKTRAMLKSKPKIVRMTKDNIQDSEKNVSVVWSPEFEKYPTIFRLNESITVENAHPILIIERIDHTSQNDSTPFASGYKFILYDNPTLELIVFAGVSKLNAQILDIHTWELNFNLNFPQNDQNMFENPISIFSDDTVPSLVEEEEDNVRLLFNITPKFLIVDQLIHARQVLDNQKRRLERESSSAPLLHHPENEILVNLAREIKDIETRINLLKKNLRLTNINDSRSAGISKIPIISKSNENPVVYSSWNPNSISPRTSDHVTTHSETFSTNNNRLDNPIDMKLNLNEEEQEETVEIFENVGKTQIEIKEELHELEKHILVLKEREEQTFFKNSYFVNLKYKILDSQIENLNGWRGLSEKQEKFVKTNFPHSISKFSQINELMWPPRDTNNVVNDEERENLNLISLYDIQEKKINVEKELMGVKVKLSELREEEPVNHEEEIRELKKKENELTHEFEIERGKFELLKPKWKLVIDKREEFLNKLVNPSSSSLECREPSEDEDSTENCDLPPKFSNIILTREKIRRRRKKQQRIQQLVQQYFTERSRLLHESDDPDLPKLSLRDMVTMENLRKSFFNNKNLFMDVVERELLQGVTVYVGPRIWDSPVELKGEEKTKVQNLYANSVPKRPVKSEEWELYPFLSRDFNKAALLLDPTLISILSQMANLVEMTNSSNWTGVGEEPTSILRPLRSLVLASHITRVDPMNMNMFRNSFDVFSLTQSGQCLNNEHPLFYGTINIVCESRNILANLSTHHDFSEDEYIWRDFPQNPLQNLVQSPLFKNLPLTQHDETLNEIYPHSSILENSNLPAQLQFNIKYHNSSLTIIPKSTNFKSTKILTRINEILSLNPNQNDISSKFKIPATPSSHFFPTPNTVFWAQFFPTKNVDQYVPDNEIRLGVTDWARRRIDPDVPDVNEYVGEDRAIFKNLNEYNYFCRPHQADQNIPSSEVYTYYCVNAMGVRLQIPMDVRHDDMYTLYRMENGLDTIIGWENLQNYFIVSGGHKNFTGGSAKDIFMIKQGFNGILNGMGGQNGLILSNDLATPSIRLINTAKTSEQILMIGEKKATLINVTHVMGRVDKRDFIQPSCLTSFVDGQGGSISQMDEIQLDLKEKECGEEFEQELQIWVRPGTKVVNFNQRPSTKFNYMVDSSVNSSVVVKNNNKRQQSQLNIFENNEGIHVIHLKFNLDLVKVKVNHLSEQHPIQINVQLPDEYEFQINWQQQDGVTSRVLAENSKEEQEIKFLFKIVTEDDDNFLQFFKSGSNYYYMKINSVALNSNVILKNPAPRFPSQWDNLSLNISDRSGRVGIELNLNLTLNDGTSSQQIKGISTMTLDGASIILEKIFVSDRGEFEFTPSYYFPLDSKMNEGGVVHGSSNTSNYFTAGDVKYKEIFGGGKSDHFKFHSCGGGGEVELISTVTQQQDKENEEEEEENILEIDSVGACAVKENSRLLVGRETIINLQHKSILWLEDLQVQSKTRIMGSFHTILGSLNDPESVTLDCTVKNVDLKGMDDHGMNNIIEQITMPSNTEQKCPNDLEINIQIWPGTKFENFYLAPATFLLTVPRTSNTNSSSSSVGSVKKRRNSLKRSIILPSLTKLNFPARHKNPFDIPTVFIWLNYTVVELEVSLQMEETVQDKIATQSRDVITVKGAADLNLDIHFTIHSLQSSTVIMTSDGARMSLFEKDGKFHPGFQFKSNDMMNNNNKVKPMTSIDPMNIFGSQNHRNYFNLVGGKFKTVHCGPKNDQIIIGPLTHVQVTQGCSGPDDILQLDLDLHDPDDKSTEVMTIDLQKMVVQSGNSTIVQKIEGHIEHFHGRPFYPDKFVGDPSTRSVDLKGSSPSREDVIIFPPSNHSYNVAVKVNPYTLIRVEGRGVFLLHFQEGHPHPQGNSASSSIHIPNSSDPTNAPHVKIMLPYTAQELRGKMVSNLTWILIPTHSSPHTLQLTVTSEEILQNLVVLTKDEAQIEFPTNLDPGSPPIQPIFHFRSKSSSEPETEEGNSTKVTIWGAKENINVFFIRDHGNGYYGGSSQDTFVLERLTSLEYLDGGGELSDDILDAQNLDHDGPVTFDLGQNQIFLAENDLQDTESTSVFLSGERIVMLEGKSFRHILGRSEAGDNLITNCHTQTVDLGGTMDLQDRNFILVSDDDTCPQDLLVKYRDSTNMVLFNGGKSGQVNLRVDEVIGQFSLFTLYDPSILLHRGSQDNQISISSNYHLNISFSELRVIDVEPRNSIISIQYAHAHMEFQYFEAKFITHHLKSYEKMLEVFESKTRLVSILNEEEINPFLHQSGQIPAHAPSDSQKRKIEQFSIPPPPIKFPTFFTRDGYEMRINHLGGVLLRKSVLTPDPIKSKIREIIDYHIHLVNHLGISLLVTVEQDPNFDVGATSSDEEEENHFDLKQTVIYIGGDDELDVLINHPTLPSHLVMAGGRPGTFKIFPTNPPTIPISLHLYKFHSAPLDEDEEPEDETNDDTKKNILNLSAFFESSRHSPSRKEEIETADIPEITQQGNDLKIIVKYMRDVKNQHPGVVTLQESKEEEDDDNFVPAIFEQKIILVDGVTHHNQLEIRLHNTAFRIMKIYKDYLSGEGWKWKLVVQNLDLNFPLPLPPSSNFNISTTSTHSRMMIFNDEPPSHYVFLSPEDLIEYRKFGVPLILQRSVVSPSKSIYRHGSSLILTNQVDPNPPFRFHWGPSYSSIFEKPGGFVITLLDIKGAMKEQNFTIVFDLSSQSDLVGISSDGKIKEENVSESIVVSYRNFDQIKEYRQGVQEMLSQYKWNRILFYFLVFLIVVSCLGLLIPLFVYILSKIDMGSCVIVKSCGGSKKKYKFEDKGTQHDEWEGGNEVRATLLSDGTPQMVKVERNYVGVKGGGYMQCDRLRDGSRDEYMPGFGSFDPVLLRCTEIEL